MSKSAYGPHHRDWETRTKPFTFRTDPELAQGIKDYAKRNNCSSAEAVRTFCQWGLDYDTFERESQDPRFVYGSRKDNTIAKSDRT